MISLKGFIIYTRNVNKSLGFYTQGLGLKCKSLNDKLAELEAGGNSVLLVHNESAAYSKCGFNPVIWWETEMFEEVLDSVKKYGALVEGDPVATPEGKIIYMEAPDGFSLALKEKSKVESSETETDSHPAAPELKKLFEKLKI